jgi:hypothetical protein
MHRSLLPCNTQSVSFIKSCPGKCLIHSAEAPQLGGQGHSKPWEIEDNSGVFGSRFQAALATCTSARERIKRCTCLLVSQEQKSLFASNTDAKPPGPERGNDELSWGLAWRTGLQDSKAFCLKAFIVERENENCGIGLSIRGQRLLLPLDVHTECRRCPPASCQGARLAFSWPPKANAAISESYLRQLKSGHRYLH